MIVWCRIRPVYRVDPVGWSLLCVGLFAGRGPLPAQYPVPAVLLRRVKEIVGKLNQQRWGLPAFRDQGRHPEAQGHVVCTDE